MTEVDVELIVSNVCNLHIMLLYHQTRSVHIAYPRMIAMFMLKKHLNVPNHIIGRRFSLTHGTVNNALTRVSNLLLTNDKFWAPKIHKINLLIEQHDSTNKLSTPSP